MLLHLASHLADPEIWSTYGVAVIAGIGSAVIIMIVVITSLVYIIMCVVNVLQGRAIIACLLLQQR
jgi:hypothetical protein